MAQSIEDMRKKIMFDNFGKIVREATRDEIRERVHGIFKLLKL